MPHITARAPDGATWTIRRRWIPHRDGIGVRQRITKPLRRAERPPTTEPRKTRWYEWIDLPLDFDWGGLVVIGIIAAALLLVFFGWPALLLGIDLIWLLLMLVLGTIGRVVLRRPWRVEASSTDERRDWYVSGFREAGRLRDELANRFQHGADPRP